VLGAEGYAKLAPADRAALMRDLGLADTLPVQYVRWLKDIASGHIWYFPTKFGFGSDASFDPATNPLLEPTEFKNDVEAALVSYFDEDSVTRGNKAFDIHANTYRIDADVVPAFEHLRFHGTPQNNWSDSGTQILPDDGGEIINWPRQNYDNGVQKNEDTGQRFKAVTRILKRLRNEMADEGYETAEPIPSYLIECLVWNVPNEDFGHYTWTEDVRHALAHLWNETRTDESCGEWGEVNELKYLFNSWQPWNRNEVNTFLQAAWDYIGFE